MFKKMSALAALCVSMGIAGCSTPTETPQAAPKLAAHAAATTFPANTTFKSSDRIGAVVDAATKSVRVMNFGDKPLTNVDVWVNSSFVGHVDTVPAMGYVKTDMSTYYDKSGNSLTAYPVRVSQVQVKSDEGTWTLMGPINE